MVESVANVFLETLGDLLVEEIKLLVGASDEVEQAKRDLRSIHAFLMKADRDERDSPTLNEYITQLKDLACKAENVLERYAMKVAFKKEGRRRSLKEKFQSYICIMCDFCSFRDVGEHARDIISRLSDLTRNVGLELGQESSLFSRQTYGHEVEHHFVGMEKDIEILVSMVKDETRSQRVVKIYGMGGLGKTTLARKIYDHPDFQSYARAWVCIAQGFQPKAVFGSILKQLDNQTYINHEMEVSKLVRRIQSLSAQRKCLVVIDDIWGNDDWEIIKQAFPMNCNVLLTTRSENVANQECYHPYKLGFMTEEQGWELLQKVALPQNFGPVETLEDIGRGIVAKCGGLPLSISVIGGILCQKEVNLAEWKKVNTNLRHAEDVERYKRVKQVMELSYNVLPYYLKPCFLYLACFPENEVIRTERLYLLWMAEGFISYHDKAPNETLRDVAERYLTDLAIRRMVQVQKGETYSPRHKFDSCRIHELVYNVCSSKAAEEGLLKHIDDIPSSIAWLGIPSSISNSISRLATIVRSSMLLGRGGVSFQRIGFEDGTTDSTRSQCLRVVVLDKLPWRVDKLMNSRYLCLRSYSYVRELPEFVCSMPYLQTLDLRLLGDVRLPNVIWKMKRLRHLFLNDNMSVIGGEKLRLDGLEELETLNEINSWTTRVEDIPKLTTLRELHVRVYDKDSFSAVVQHMSNNGSRSSCETHLHVNYCDFSSDVLKNLFMSPLLVALDVSNCSVVGAGFPCYERGMGENLVDLTLSRVRIGGDVMEELGKFPMLERLCLKGREVGRMTETITCRSNSFPQLKSLSLSQLLNLKKWGVEEGAMPKLTHLFIDRCWYLEKVPDGLRFISTLRRMRLFKMPKELNDSIRERGQDYATIAHIPSMDIYGL